MKNLLKLKGRYYYNRRVPELIRQYHKRDIVRIALGTDSKEEAIRKSICLNAQIEQYWQMLIIENKEHSQSEYKKLVQLARLFEFKFLPSSKVAGVHLEELLSRIKTLECNSPNSELHTKALLGTEKEDTITVSKSLERFWNLARDRSMNKSDSQLRKWRNPRIKAVNNFIEVVGNLPLNKITREHILKFRNWWIDRIKKGMNESTANKDFIHLKNVIETVCENEDIEIDTTQLFKKINIKERFSQTRKPLTSAYIKNDLLDLKRLSDFTKEEKYVLFALADTGARLAEITGLEPEDIHLDTPVPYISIKDRKNRPLKTPHSQRTIPLVGYSLLAFQQCPNGFPSYRGKSDVLSSKLNRILRLNNLLPSKMHSVYSLRHSFQDRLLAVNAPDRVQAELMGHQFHRPRYGDGATLEHKYQWLQKACVDAHVGKR